jgi:hypothetical protein
MKDKAKLRNRKKLSVSTKKNVYFCLFSSALCLLIAFVIDDYLNTDILLVRVLQEFLVGASGLLGVSVVWEMIGKSSFANELLTKFKISEDLKNTNIECVYDTFSDVDWNNILKEATSFKGFISYGYTWRNDNRSYLKNAIVNCTKDNFIMVFPDYNEKDIVNELNKRFGYNRSKKNVKDYIEESVKWFLENGAKVYLFNGTLCSSFYIYNNHCLYPLNKHGTEKASVPVIKFKSNGSLYKHVVSDFDRILKESKQVELMEDKNVKYCE